MNLLPEKMPVKVYTSQDKNAPLLDKSPNCMATIFKACLITGYGDKAGAGWTMPFEDSQKGIKVFRPPISAEQDFYLRVSQDDGKKMLAQVYTSMTDINTGELKLQLDNVFNYAKTNNTGKWVMIVSPRGFWFLTEQYFDGFATISNSGSYFYCGDSCKANNGNKLICLMHTGGYDANLFLELGSYDQNQPNKHDLTPCFYDAKTNLVNKIKLDVIFSPLAIKTNDVNLANIYFYSDKILYLLPAVYTSSSGASHQNYQTLNMAIDDDATLIAVATGNARNNSFFVRTDYWIF